MGISGLLPLLKEVQIDGHISQYKGKKQTCRRRTLSGYVWLHKGAFGCAEDLVKGKKTFKYVDYVMYKVRYLRHHGIEPFMVFDGGPLPAKRGTEMSRARSRAEHLERARGLEAQGRIKEAKEAYTRCLDVSPAMAFQVIKALRAENVDYVVAPYEADAQLCFLEREGYVDGIITEDSDLLVFGCKLVIYKLDHNGHCVSLHRERLSRVREFPMHGWTDVQFRRMAMLSGCDYLDSLPGIGIKTAHRLMRRFHTVEKLLQHLRMEGTPVPSTYLPSFNRAELAFLHQRVFDPDLGRVVPLNPIPPDIDENGQQWVGENIDEEIARGIARGEICPETREALVDWWPEFQVEARGGKGFNGIVSGSGSMSGSGSGSERLRELTPVAKRSGKTIGPMDAFLVGTKVKSQHLPKPVGTYTSGPSRLADQIPMQQLPHDLEENKKEEPAPGKTSKFFSFHKRRQSSTLALLDANVEGEMEELIWEDVLSVARAGDGKDTFLEMTQVSEADDQERNRSPSPAVSSLGGESPAKSQLSLEAVTSPLAIPSSPPFSSPPRQVAVKKVLARTSFFTPTPTSASGSTRRHASIEADAETKSEQQQGTWSKGLRVSKILVPASSIQTILSPSPSITSPPVPEMQKEDAETIQMDVRRHIKYEDSSDTPQEEDVVTPSFNSSRSLTRKRKSSASTRVKKHEGVEAGAMGADVCADEEEVDLEEMKRKEKAKTVGGGWKMKYAFGAGRNSNSSSPAPDTPGMKTPKIASDLVRNQLKAFSNTTPECRILKSQPSNVPSPTPLAFVSTQEPISKPSKRSHKNSAASANKKTKMIREPSVKWTSSEVEEESEEIGSFDSSPPQKKDTSIKRVGKAGGGIAKLEKYRFGAKQ